MEKITAFTLTFFIYSLINSGSVICAQDQATVKEAVESPQDYTVSYAFKNSDGTLFRVIKYYLLEGVKFRSEYYSYTSPIMLSVGVEAEIQLDSTTVKEEPTVVEINEETESQAPDMNIEPHTIMILRKDKNLVWSMDPSFKQYFEVPLQQDAWERAITRPLIDSMPDLKKTGEMKLLDHQCDVYESVMLVNENNWTSIIIAAKDVVLKKETWRNGDLFEIMEVTEFSLAKPAASLFEVPHGYQKNESNQ